MYREGSRCTMKYAMHDIKQLKNCLPDLLTKYGNQRLKQKADAVKEKLQVLHVFHRFRPTIDIDVELDFDTWTKNVVKSYKVL